MKAVLKKGVVYAGSAEPTPFDFESHLEEYVRDFFIDSQKVVIGVSTALLSSSRACSKPA